MYVTCRLNVTRICNTLYPNYVWLFQVVYSVLLTKILYAVCFIPICATRPAHLILLVAIPRITLGEQCKSWSSSLCSCLQSPVTFSHLVQSISLGALFLSTPSLCSSFNVSSQSNSPIKQPHGRLKNYAFDSWHWQNIVFINQLGPTQPSNQSLPGVLSLELSCQGMKLTSHFYRLLRLRNMEAYLFSLHTPSCCAQAHLYNSLHQNLEQTSRVLHPASGSTCKSVVFLGAKAAVV
jgi:hypothetical protein